jgi:hypothetical protein
MRRMENRVRKMPNERPHAIAIFCVRLMRSGSTIYYARAASTRSTATNHT